MPGMCAEHDPLADWTRRQQALEAAYWRERDWEPSIFGEPMPIPPEAHALPVSVRFVHRFHHRLRHRIPVWTVFYPDNVVHPGRWPAFLTVLLPEVRVTRMRIIADSLDGVRDALPPRLVNIGRMLNDDPTIREVWI